MGETTTPYQYNSNRHVVLRLTAFLIQTAITLVFAHSSLAATITVSNTSDSGPGSLRQAIASALPGDIITFGVSGMITLTGGELLINKDLTINGPGASSLSLSGNNASRVFNISAGNINVSEVTIRDGNPGEGSIGGGILVLNNASLTIVNSIIKDNTAGGGGGIYYVASGALSVVNTTITGNSASGGGGGLLCSFGSYSLNNVIINGNTTNFNGGGILNSSGTMTVINSTVSGNSSRNGGGIFSSDTLVLNGCAVTENSASFDGGGIFNQGNLTITNSTLKSNSAGTFGGGISNDGNAGSMQINDTTISGNNAELGGGVFNNINSLTVSNSTISGNSASNGGGVLINSGTVALAYATVNDNSATNLGGGIDNNAFGTVTLRNTILAGSHISTNCSGTFTSLGHNLDSGNSCGLAGPGDLINTDPLLGPLQINVPGTTATHALLAGSPAIDAADPASFPPADQRGVTRPQGAGPDIGAYEVCNADPVYNDRSGHTYTSIQDAYDDSVNTVDGDRLLILATNLSGGFTSDRNISITLEGGLNCDFSNVVSLALIQGMVTIQQGEIILSGIVIQ